MFVYFANGTFYSSLNGMRQFIAVMMIFYGYTFLTEKKFFHWCLVVFFAGLFHKSAFFVFPVYFFLRIKFSPFFINIILFVATVLHFVDISSVLYNVFSLFPPPYNSYANVVYVVKSQGSGAISLLLLVEAFILNNLRKDKFTMYENVQFNSFVLAVSLISVFYQFIMVTRIADYFFMSVAIMYPCLEKLSKKNMYLYILFIGLTSILTLNLLKLSLLGTVENKLYYRTIFSK